MGGAEGIDHIHSGGEEHGVALQTGLMSQGGGPMSLAQPDTAQKDNIGVVGEEGEAEEILHLSAIDFAGPSPVERFEGFDSGKMSGLNPSLNPVFASAMTFAFQKTGEVFYMGPVLFSGLGGQGLIVFLGEAQLQFLELDVEFWEG